jgi:hypothetical protein
MIEKAVKKYDQYQDEFVIKLDESETWVGAREEASKARSCTITGKYVAVLVLKNIMKKKHEFLINLDESESWEVLEKRLAKPGFA